MTNKYRDPIHGFIEVSEGEDKIINSKPFQRLRNIKQLAMTYLVFHGAEHTRFGHSLGVMFLVTKAFDSAVKNGNGDYKFSDSKREWYKQILRIIALTHDLGHAPFSHASEAVFPEGLEHEDFTEKIIKETCIANFIREIGADFKAKHGSEFDITPELICDIYMGREAGEKSEFTFLKSFMDSEMDCDKMDYLLRDSMFCGVNYGKFDIERLICSLTIYKQEGEGGRPRLAILNGGVQSFEEFVLARYFMFVQVYFHRTRRYFDIMLANALQQVLPNGRYPDSVQEYLKWDDCRVIQSLEQNSDNFEACKNICCRIVYPRVFHTTPDGSNREVLDFFKDDLYDKFGKENFIEDRSAGKMPHKIPVKSELDDERAIVIVDTDMGKCTTISDESHIIKSLTDKIDIRRLYVKPELKENVRAFIREKNQRIRKQ